MGGSSVKGQEVLDFSALTNILNGESTTNCMYTVRSSEIFMIFLFLISRKFMNLCASIQLTKIAI